MHTSGKVGRHVVVVPVCRRHEIDKVEVDLEIFRRCSQGTQLVTREREVEAERVVARPRGMGRLKHTTTRPVVTVAATRCLSSLRVDERQSPRESDDGEQHHQQPEELLPYSFHFFTNLIE